MGTKTGIDSIGTALFGKSRQAILGLLFSHSDEAFYLRQIARLTALNLGSVQREVERLTRVGIINRVSKGKEVFFRANPACPVFSDLKNLIIKTSGAVEVIKQALSSLDDKVRIAFIYGSVATGKETPESDIDLLVIGALSLAEAVKALTPAERILHREINPTIYPVAEFKTKLKAGHHFLTSLMAGPKLFVIGDQDELSGLAKKRMA